MNLAIFLITFIGVAVFAAVVDYINFQDMMDIANIRYEIDQLNGQ